MAQGQNTLVVDTPVGIHMYRLLALRGMLRLEMKGMQRSRRPSATMIVKDLFSLPKNMSREETLVRLEQEIREAQCHASG